MKVLDKKAVNQRIIEVCEHYLGTGSGGGERRVWPCPECAKRNFRVHASRGVGGCFSAGCDMPNATDAIGIIGYFEGLGDHGREFLRRVEKGYEVLGLQTGPTPGPASEHQSYRDAQTAKERSEGANGSSASGDGNHNEQRIQWVAGAGPGDDRHFGAQPTTDDARRIAGAAADGAPKPAADKDKTTRRLVRERPLTAYIKRPGGMREAVEAVRIEEVDEESYRRETADAVYRRILELCPVQKRDITFWHSRSVSPETVERGKFGSLCKERHRHLPAALGRTFSEDELLCVGGFYKTDQGKIGFNLRGDYALIPYHDAQGYINTIEGRLLGEPREDEAKYKALINSGSHLYVFPEYHPQELVAFCEGVIGAIVAAQSGIAVGSIKGFRAYRSWSSETGYEPLPEMRDVDFGGRKIVYIPDTDVKPKVREEVEAEAPAAGEWLVTRQNGRPKLAQLPQENKDLDEWLLSMAAEERVEAFTGLMRKAVSPEGWLQEKQEQAPADTLLEALHERAQAKLRAGEGEVAEVPSEQSRVTDVADPERCLTAAPEKRPETGEEGNAEQHPADAHERGPTADTGMGDTEAVQAMPGTPPEDEDPREKISKEKIRKPEQLPLADENHFGEASHLRRNRRRDRTNSTKRKVGQESSKKETEEPDPEGTGPTAQAATQTGQDAPETGPSQDKPPHGETRQSAEGTENSSESGSRDDQSAGEDKQQEVRHKRQLRPSQQKWYDSLEKPTIYRPPEEREKKPKPEPQRPSTDHLRPEYLNYAEVVLALFIIAVISAVAWVAGEYLLAEAVLSSPLGRLEATGWVSRMSFYIFVGCGVSFGVWLWRYKRRRRALIRHLTGGARSS